jgi:hypothetical protein
MTGDTAFLCLEERNPLLKNFFQTGYQYVEIERHI